MCFAETWLRDCIEDSHVTIDGFSLIRGNRTEQSEREKGGGVCVYVKNKMVSS